MANRQGFTGEGYYLNHHEKKSHSGQMRFELNLQTLDKNAAKKFGVPMENIQIRMRENTPLRTGGCEIGMTLTIEQAKELVDVLLDGLFYDLPDIREILKRGRWRKGTPQPPP